MKDPGHARPGSFCCLRERAHPDVVTRGLCRVTAALELRSLQHPSFLEGHIRAVANNEVIEHRDVQKLARFGNNPRD